MSDEIPEWAMEAATQVAVGIFGVMYGKGAAVELIARALVKAHQNGREDEHELWSNLVKSGCQGAVS